MLATAKLTWIRSSLSDEDAVSLTRVSVGKGNSKKEVVVVAPVNKGKNDAFSASIAVATSVRLAFPGVENSAVVRWLRFCGLGLIGFPPNNLPWLLLLLLLLLLRDFHT
jgi:hypothetical protein